MARKIDQNLKEELNVLVNNIVKVSNVDTYDVNSNENLFQRVPVLPRFINDLIKDEPALKDLNIKSAAFVLDSEIKDSKRSLITFKFGTYTEDYEEQEYSEGWVSKANAKLMLNDKTPILNSYLQKYEEALNKNNVREDVVFDIYAKNNNFIADELYSRENHHKVKDKSMLAYINHERPEYVDKIAFDNDLKAIEKDIASKYIVEEKLKSKLNP